MPNIPTAEDEGVDLEDDNNDGMMLWWMVVEMTVSLVLYLISKLLLYHAL